MLSDACSIFSPCKLPLESMQLLNDSTYQFNYRRLELILVRKSCCMIDSIGLHVWFREAVQKSWNANPPLLCTLDQFYFGRIEIPSEVAQKQLESKIQNERNDRKSYVQ